MLRKTPKSFNAVDMILAVMGKGLAVVQPVMLAPALQRIVTAKGISVIDRAFSGMLFNMAHQLVSGCLFHDLGVHSAITLQKPKYNAFSGSATAALALPSAAEIGLVNFDLAFKLAGLKFSDMIDRLAHALVDAGNRLIVQAQVARHAIRRLLLVKTSKDGDLFAQLFQGLLFSTGLVAASHIAAPRPIYPERAAEYALSAPQKVGGTVENVVSSSNHKGILALDGYESN